MTIIILCGAILIALLFMVAFERRATKKEAEQHFKFLKEYMERCTCLENLWKAAPKIKEFKKRFAKVDEYQQLSKQLDEIYDDCYDTVSYSGVYSCG